MYLQPSAPLKFQKSDLIDWLVLKDKSPRPKLTQFSQVFHTRIAKVLLAKAAEIRTMDAIYLLMLAGLYVVTHGLVLALNRLGKTS
jgi:hypothetical protein